MLHQFELAMISTGIWPADMGIPYFDWSAMSQNWWTSDIFNDRHFGELKSRDPSKCVLTGVFAKGKYVVAADPDRHRVVTGSDQTCLRRNADQTPLTDASTITASLSPTSFIEFTGHNKDESNFHANGHAFLGGDGGDMWNPSVSPNDPLFFLHHGFVDKYWWRWQTQCEAFKHDYQGRLARADDPVGDGTINASKHLYVNSWPFTVGQLLDTQGDTLCYTYSRSAGDLPPPSIICPFFDAAAEQNATATPTPRPPGATVDDTWLTKALISLIQRTSISFKNDLPADSPATDTPVVFGRDDEFGFNSTTDTTGPTNSLSASVSTRASATLSVDTTRSERESYSATRTVNSSSNANASITVSASASVNASASASQSASASATSIPTPIAVPKTYNVTVTKDNSTIVSYSFSNITVKVDTGYKIVEVYPTSVVTTDVDGNLKHFFPMEEKVQYIPNPEAPQEVEVGSHPCYLAYPKPLSCEYVQSMGMCCQKFENSYNRVKMAIDAFNANNCTTLYSPSSLMNQNL
ncbi:UNVERIFIED_CONTAM: hypothetical protein HDU68_004690 [Siphonaria sp. JEL0065]|nr:hypothetical protein HDU68_004690 [Siphonaria sp. JEL0065]